MGNMSIYKNLILYVSFYDLINKGPLLLQRDGEIIKAYNHIERAFQKIKE